MKDQFRSDERIGKVKAPSHAAWRPGPHRSVYGERLLALAEAVCSIRARRARKSRSARRPAGGARFSGETENLTRLRRTWWRGRCCRYRRTCARRSGIEQVAEYRCGAGHKSLPPPPLPEPILVTRSGTNLCASANRLASRIRVFVDEKPKTRSRISSYCRSLSSGGAPQHFVCARWPSEMKVDRSRSPCPWLQSACAFWPSLHRDFSTRSLCWSAVALAVSDSIRFSCAPFSWMKAFASCVASCSAPHRDQKLGRDCGFAEPMTRISDLQPDSALDLALDQRPLVDQIQHLGRAIDGDEDRLAFGIQDRLPVSVGRALP